MASECRDILLARDACKASLGLAPESCYPASYADECGATEHALRKCLAFASCRKHAAVLYDSAQPRQRRAAANRRLQKCLRKKHASEIGCERSQAQAQ